MPIAHILCKLNGTTLHDSTDLLISMNGLQPALTMYRRLLDAVHHLLPNTQESPKVQQRLYAIGLLPLVSLHFIASNFATVLASIPCSRARLTKHPPHVVIDVRNPTFQTASARQQHGTRYYTPCCRLHASRQRANSASSTALERKAFLAWRYTSTLYGS